MPPSLGAGPRVRVERFHEVRVCLRKELQDKLVKKGMSVSSESGMKRALDSFGPGAFRFGSGT